jgi:signal transduction histidine kinase
MKGGAVRKDGGVFPIEVLDKPINFGGAPSRVLSVRDLTEQKKTEAEQKILRERIHRLEKMESLGRVVGGVAHDLNNILGISVGYSELLLDEISVDHPLRKDLQTIMDSSQKASDVVQNLLIMAGKSIVVNETLDLNKVVSDCLGSPEYAKLAMSHGNAHIELRLAQKPMVVSGSKIHIGKVIMNLLSNAVEAISGNGSITLIVEDRSIENPVSAFEEIMAGEYVVLTVSDTGKGISPDDMPLIFEPFYTTKHMGKRSSGLGLSTVWGVVKNHDGYIDVQSEQGKGATFILYFPKLTRISNI